jgi:hypothetical protein
MNLLSEELFILEEVRVSRMWKSTIQYVSTALDQNIGNLNVSWLVKTKLDQDVTR